MKITVITGSRADWSGLELCAAALKSAGHEVTGFTILTPVVRDDRSGVAFRSVEQYSALIDALIYPLDPELVLLGGDRSEVLLAATAAYMLRVPIAHLGGGDITRGSADDQMRDAISMLASMHFATNPEAYARLLNMGIRADRLFQTGAPALDRIVKLPRVSRETAFGGLKISSKRHNVLVAVHPDTVETSDDLLTELLHALVNVEAVFEDEISFYFCEPNADVGRRALRQRMAQFCADRPGYATMIGDLPPDRFVQLMRHCDALVGNSSAGIYEAPCCGIPSINIGDRQSGRALSPSVLPLRAARKDITSAICDMLQLRYEVPMPDFYGDGHAVERIVGAIGMIKNPRELLRRT